ncbi:SDR family NAD(P)-dependent oxidoreductase [Paeniglutamicibacter sulfureus]|uniref:Short-subunit dehydrogenase n=1 Tax=Paeniglutamicibacter sulfureus TaxID=43666 RepID=A0ABU2BIT7_9MICC|nr:SDR family NAD(P)-dependent oxidoreductase [Paeniglutamicibacter sulfureus]MDO2934365.1 SDR family NAD(P)-dependent oxidoreductase [Paeniglutamicibacter sulfureus]MDR7358562.1 short-subunit dehydrogenase [Paeniglutamicibacter sulfureus]
MITGASSGIGRATAHTFAKAGARLVLAARSAETLQEVAAECTTHGAQVIAVPTDISDESQVQALIHSAVEAFGRIDVCIGGASVYSYGTFETTPPDVFRRIVETNLFGPVHTARAVLPHFRNQGHGTLILIGSVYAKITSPYISPYVTSKFGLLGFTEVLRQELQKSKHIHICLVLPATIDTPIYQHAANYTGKRVHPLPPVASPHRVARAIMGNAKRPRPVTVVGQIQRTFVPVHGVFPRFYDRCINPVMDLLALRKGPVSPSSGTVFAPDPSSNHVTGNWRSNRIRGFGTAGTILGLWLILRHRRQPDHGPRFLVVLRSSGTRSIEKRGRLKRCDTPEGQPLSWWLALRRFNVKLRRVNRAPSP